MDGSPEMSSEIATWSDIRLCWTAHDNWWSSARSDEFKYKGRKAVINELDSRKLDCREFPSLKEKWTGWMREWIRDYEEEKMLPPDQRG